MKSNRRATLALAAAVCALSATTGTQALAQTTNYPTKAVRILVGSPPGGGTDILARLVAEKFTGEFKQSFVVDNKPGASNTIAADMTARAEHDGHTLLMATIDQQAARIGGNDFAAGRGQHAARQAFKQAFAQHVFGLGQQLGCGRLAHIERRSRTAHMALSVQQTNQQQLAHAQSQQQRGIGQHVCHIQICIDFDPNVIGRK